MTLNYSDCPVWFDIYLKYSKKYKRVGVCSSCGDCCNSITYQVNWDTPDYEVLGVENVSCKMWDKEKKVCKNYLMRAMVCRVFPMKPDDLKYLPHCTYKFEEIKNESN